MGRSSARDEMDNSRATIASWIDGGRNSVAQSIATFLQRGERELCSFRSWLETGVVMEELTVKAKPMIVEREMQLSCSRVKDESDIFGLAEWLAPARNGLFWLGLGFWWQPKPKPGRTAWHAQRGWFKTNLSWRLGDCTFWRPRWGLSAGFHRPRLMSGAASLGRPVGRDAREHSALGFGIGQECSVDKERIGTRGELRLEKFVHDNVHLRKSIAYGSVAQYLAHLPGLGIGREGGPVEIYSDVRSQITKYRCGLFMSK
ncbi:hypothetical protein FB451DRAFT_1194685 [Mycena latifolia]|nr:hypothetical protein FB451DRAFT_1194685 [Mycena latifolia]